MSQTACEVKREVFSVFSDELRRQVKERGLSEDEILEDFKSWRKLYTHRLKPVPPRIGDRRSVVQDKNVQTPGTG
jgi:hypothetical protein